MATRAAEIEAAGGARLDGRVAFITGAGSGMGRAMAEEFAARGADVVACDLVADAAAAARDAARGAGSGQALAVTADVSDGAAVTAAVDATLARLGRVDVLCSNAGILDDYATALETDEALWNRVLAVNLTATYLLAHAVLPGMVERGSGVIVTTCSLASHVAGGGGAAYTASKHGLLGLTRQLAYDYAAKGVRCNAICPGLIETGMTKPLLDDPTSGAHKFVHETPSNTWGQPRDVAKLAAFLASDDARFIHGASVCIDGGWTIK
jgi:3-oxoacyl-[acyl-carrier protein] reductase